MSIVRPSRPFVAIPPLLVLTPLRPETQRQFSSPECSVVSDSFVTPWTVTHQAPPSLGFSRQEYWSGLPFPSPGDLANPGIEPRSPALQADALTSEPPRMELFKNHSRNKFRKTECQPFLTSHWTFLETRDKMSSYLNSESW